MITYTILFCLALMLSLILTPIVMQSANHFGLISVPNERSIHNQPMPLAGGTAIFISFSVVYVTYELIINPATEYVFIGILGGTTLITFVGLLDDKYTLSPKMKLVGQLLSTTPLLVTGVTLNSIFIPFVELEVVFGPWSYILTIVWIVAIVNAVNLIDGLDGLCGGLMAIAAMTYFMVSLSLGNEFVATLSIILFGAILGFMKFNIYPAKIFLGDTGSLFLGYFMASLSLLELKQVAFTSFIFPFLILGIPMIDTVYAILRRKIAGRPLTQADRNHLHHCLLDMGLSQKQAVWTLYAISGIFSLSAVISSKVAFELSFVLLVIYVLFIQTIAKKVGLLPRRKT